MTDLRLRALFLLALASPAGAQSLAPVPQEELAGRTLRVAAANFSVEAPDDGWVWSFAALPKGRLYACSRSADGRMFMVFYQEDGRRRMSEHSFETFGEGVLESVRQRGFQVGSLVHESSDRPFAGAYRFRATMLGPNQQAARLLGMAGASDRLYSVTAILTGDADERLFEQFLASFRLLRPVPLFPKLSVGLAIGDLALLALSCWALFAMLRDHTSLAGPLVALWACLAVVYVGLAARAVVTGARTPDDLDFVLGRVAGASLAVAVGGLIYRLTHRAPSFRRA